MQGFIKFEREWLDNPIIRKDSDYIAAFLYIAVNVQFESREVMFGKEKITLRKGQMITTKRQIYESLGIERNKLDRIMRDFKSEELIKEQTNMHKTLITLLLVSDFQGKIKEQNEEPISNRQGSEQDRESEKEKRSKREKDKEKEQYKNVKIKEVCVDSTHGKIALGTYQNVFVDREWYEDFCYRYSYADRVINRLSLFKEAKGIENERDEPYLEEFAVQDRDKYQITKRQPTYGDADEAMEMAFARTLEQDDDDDYDF